MVYFVGNQPLEIGTLFQNSLGKNYRNPDNSVKKENIPFNLDVNYIPIDYDYDAKLVKFNNNSYTNDQDEFSDVPQPTEDTNVSVAQQPDSMVETELPKSFNINNVSRMSEPSSNLLMDSSVNNNLFQDVISNASYNINSKETYKNRTGEIDRYYNDSMKGEDDEESIKVDINDFLSNDGKIESFNEMMLPDRNKLHLQLLNTFDSYVPVDENIHSDSILDAPNLIKSAELTNLRRLSRSAKPVISNKSSTILYGQANNPRNTVGLKSQKIDPPLIQNKHDLVSNKMKGMNNTSEHKHKYKTIIKVQNSKNLKKSNNIVEKRYRSNINEKMTYLKEIVPSLRVASKRENGIPIIKEDSIDLDGLQPAKKLNKASILLKTIEYIRHLENKCHNGIQGNNNTNDRYRN
ncbi:hypothetical protein TPHA_0C00390 [Tetrapisispora phaffii CBS 4417]|uniref:BHLH domain-containing protein n=1 Tax=Tetrapisispora phaffii (strain ATCC 24235 / CBS 4417 / NBRC 1672 / NRRL Y-8282 / UCD 70-5) TaxID=1071381 RepID=G8BR20_TETPH|nr:hypothetical protein TPHA_0C00390 [Tetrapisispora phaffii CBS 4417]CCE62196.1 hypothetical protein TPHA_0C00390 [Tetrapisispora phaffii CBS 4417]